MAAAPFNAPPQVLRDGQKLRMSTTQTNKPQTATAGLEATGNQRTQTGASNTSMINPQAVAQPGPTSCECSPVLRGARLLAAAEAAPQQWVAHGVPSPTVLNNLRQEVGAGFLAPNIRGTLDLNAQHPGTMNWVCEFFCLTCKTLWASATGAQKKTALHAAADEALSKLAVAAAIPQGPRQVTRSQPQLPVNDARTRAVVPAAPLALPASARTDAMIAILGLNNLFPTIVRTTLPPGDYGGGILNAHIDSTRVVTTTYWVGMTFLVLCPTGTLANQILTVPPPPGIEGAFRQINPLVQVLTGVLFGYDNSPISGGQVYQAHGHSIPPFTLPAGYELALVGWSQGGLALSTFNVYFAINVGGLGTYSRFGRDVSLVGMSQQEGPLWVTDVRPQGVPLVPPTALSEAVRAVEPAPRHTGSAAADQAAHNAEMHAGNGNGFVSALLTQIDAPTITEVSEFEERSPVPDNLDLSQLPDWVRDSLEANQQPPALDKWCESDAIMMASRYVADEEGPYEPIDQNYFKPLVDLTDLEEYTLEDEAEPRAMRIPRKITEAPPKKKEGSGPPRRKAETPTEAAPSTKVALDPTAKARNRAAVLKRLSSQLCEMSSRRATQWFMRWLWTKNPSRNLGCQVWRQYTSDIGRDTALNIDNANEWAISCYLTAADSAPTNPLVRGWEVYQRTPRADPSFGEWLQTQGLDRLTGEEQLKDGFLAAQASAHNAAMHAANGNIVVAKTMADVDAAPSTQECYAQPAGELPRINPVAMEMAVTAFDTAPGKLSDNVSQGSLLRYDSQLLDNTVFQRLYIEPPEACFMMRTVRDPNNPAAIINSAIRTLGGRFQAYPLPGLPLTATELDGMIIEAAIKANNNLGRSDNTNLNGFHAFDLAYLSRLKSIRGLTMDSCYLKLMLLHNIVSWVAQPDTLPMITAGSSDPETLIRVSNAPLAGINNSPVFGESCGGNDPVFPCQAAGTKGLLHFHVSFETVPNSERGEAVMLPANLLAGDKKPALMIALFVLMWSDWPHAFYTHSFDTTDIGGLNPGVQIALHFASLTRVPGKTLLHVVLPRSTTSRNPTAQAEANAMVLHRPQAGPTASVGGSAIAANALLNVNYRGGNIIAVSLADYLYTWWTQFDTPSIAQFLIYMNAIYDIGKELDYAVEEAACQSWRHTRLTAEAPNIPIDVPYNLKFFDTTGQGHSLSQLRSPPADFPFIPNTAPMAIVAEPDVVAWNKVASGLAVPMGKGPQGVATFAELHPILGHYKAAYWSELINRAYSCAVQVHHLSVGVPAEMWRTAYDNTDNQAYRAIIRAHYVNNSGGFTGAMKPPMGKAMERLMGNVMGYSPSTGSGGVSPLSNWLPTDQNYVTIENNIGGNLVTTLRAFIPDLWIWSHALKVPKWYMPFPTTSGGSGYQGMLRGGVMDVVSFLQQPNRWMAPVSSDHFRTTIAQNATYDLTDAERWNARVFLNASSVGIAGPIKLEAVPNAIMYTMAGLPVAGVPLQGEVPKFRHYPIEASVNGLSTLDIGVSSGVQCWWGGVQENGLPIGWTLPRANVINVTQVLAGKRIGIYEVTLRSEGMAGPSLMLGGMEHRIDSVWASLAMDTGQTPAEQLSMLEAEAAKFKDGANPTDQGEGSPQAK